MRRHLPVLGILTLALGLRLFHIGWGLPEVYEEATPYRKAWAFWNWGNPGLDLHPRFFNYPALTFYVHFGVQATHYAAGRASGTYRSLEEFRVASERDPGTALLLARLANAAMDLGTVLFVLLLARRLAGEVAALLAGGLVAAAPLHLQQAQMVNVDVPLTLLTTAALYLFVRLQEEGTARQYVLAGLAVGLAASAKYTGALLAVPLVAAVAVRERRAIFSGTILRRIALAGVVAVGVFALMNPYIFLDLPRFLQDFGFERRHMTEGHFGIRTETSTVGFYVIQVLPAALGILPVLFAIAGPATLRRRARAQNAVLAVWLVTYLAVLFSWTMRADRYLLPVMPVIAVWASFAAVRLWERMTPQTAGRPFRIASAAVLGIVLLGEPVSADLRYYRAATLPDTRDIAREWIERTLSPGAVAAMGPLGLTLKPPLVTFPIPYRSVGFEEFAPFYDARWYEDLDLAVGSNFDLARFQQEPGRFREFLRYYYDSLAIRWSLVFQLEPVRGQRGPAIWLYAPVHQAPAVYDTALFGRLRGVSSTGVLRAFAGNLLAIQTARGNRTRVIQLLEWQAEEYTRRGLWKDASAALDRLLRMRPGDPRLTSMRDTVAVRLR
jgi:4-amino-4-deoxy-L-arabinose transferase-like glycosyltransferase